MLRFAHARAGGHKQASFAEALNGDGAARHAVTHQLGGHRLRPAH